MTKPKYAVCENCKQEMALGVACLYTHFLKEGKLIGSMDFAGQMQLIWAAVKRQ